MVSNERRISYYSRFQNGCHTGLGCRGARSSACGRSQDTEVQRYDHYLRTEFRYRCGPCFRAIAGGRIVTLTEGKPEGFPEGI